MELTACCCTHNNLLSRQVSSSFKLDHLEPLLFSFQEPEDWLVSAHSLLLLQGYGTHCLLLYAQQPPFLLFDLNLKLTSSKLPFLPRLFSLLPDWYYGLMHWIIHVWAPSNDISSILDTYWEGRWPRGRIMALEPGGRGSIPCLGSLRSSLISIELAELLRSIPSLVPCCVWLVTMALHGHCGLGQLSSLPTSGDDKWAASDSTLKQLTLAGYQILVLYFTLAAKPCGRAWRSRISDTHRLQSSLQFRYIGAVHKVCHAFFDDFWPPPLPPVTNCHKSWTPPP